MIKDKTKNIEKLEAIVEKQQDGKFSLVTIKVLRIWTPEKIAVIT